MLFLVSVFFMLGWIDKARLDQASLTNKPKLVFAHEKIIVKDGGSVIWESFIYSAGESRHMEVIQLNDMHIIDGFQGVNWKWEFHNLLWILLTVGVSFTYQFITERKSS